VFQAFISKVRSVDDIVGPQIRSSTVGSAQPVSGLRRLRNTLGMSPGPLRRRNRDSGSENGDKNVEKRHTLSFFNKKLSKSLHDIFHWGRSNNDDEDDDDTRQVFMLHVVFGYLQSIMQGLWKEVIVKLLLVFLLYQVK
jgi:hypothetical protein